MKLYLFSINASKGMPSGDTTLMLNFTEQTEPSRVLRPGQGGNVVISDEVPLVFTPFMPIDAVINFFRQIADHLESQVTEHRNSVTISGNGD